MSTGTAVEPMHAEQAMEFPYKHSTGETVGRFLAGLKEQKTIWGQRVAGQGVVVPPLGYSEIDASPAGEWVAVKDTGTSPPSPVVHQPLERLHRSSTPFAYVLVKLDGADTALRARRQGRSRRGEGRRARAGRVGGGRCSATGTCATSPAFASSGEAERTSCTSRRRNRSSTSRPTSTCRTATSPATIAPASCAR